MSMTDPRTLTDDALIETIGRLMDGASRGA
jgi:hypothetical protein